MRSSSCGYLFFDEALEKTLWKNSQLAYSHHPYKMARVHNFSCPTFPLSIKDTSKIPTLSIFPSKPCEPVDMKGKFREVSPLGHKWKFHVCHYYISDNPKHDKIFVQKCFLIHQSYLKENDLIPTLHYVRSNGCSSQIKGTRSWFHVSRYKYIIICGQLLPHGCTMQWDYVSWVMVKGPYDGAGDILNKLMKWRKSNKHKELC